MKEIGDAEPTAPIGFQTIAQSRKAGWVRHQFDEVAARYDMMNTLLSFGIHHLWKCRAIGMLDLKPGEKVLDVCGGTGDLAVSASKRVGAAGRVVLYDINRQMMEAGRLRAFGRKFRHRIIYVQGDAEQMAFPDGFFDAVIVGFGVRNLTRMEKGFAEMHRVLRPGGRMVCLEFSQPAAPLFRRVYDLYSFHVMPRLGKLLTGSARAYTYLPESIRLFPSPDSLKFLLEHIGFSHGEYLRLTGGVAVIHRGIRKTASGWGQEQRKNS
ncbi:MAG: bifunctional demethylmenaquinone methyltransferase/2-methoxy-6-polyprenyl-1,4-benzoquinol methylase UbiE [Desulfobacterales bacterium]